MAFTAHEQELYDFARAALPRFLFQKATAAEDWIGGFVKEFDAARTQVDGWISLTYITNATGIWLDQHAKDRGTRRQSNESDPALRTRLRTIDDAVNVQSLKNAATAALQADGVTIPAGYPAVVETRRDRAFMGTYAATAPGSLHPNYDSRSMNYLSRGERMGLSRSGTIIVILPYPTTATTAASVYEACRKKKAGGFLLIVERRLNP